MDSNTLNKNAVIRIEELKIIPTNNQQVLDARQDAVESFESVPSDGWSIYNRYSVSGNLFRLTNATMEAINTCTDPDELGNLSKILKLANHLFDMIY